MDQLDVLLKTRSGALEALTHCFLPKSGFCFILEQYNTNPLSDISAYILNNNKLQTAFLLSFNFTKLNCAFFFVASLSVALRLANLVSSDLKLTPTGL